MVRNRVLLVLVATGAAAALWLPFLRHAPNRLLSGRPISVVAAITDGFSVFQLLCCASAAVLAAGPFLPRAPAVHRWVGAAASTLVVSLVCVAGLEATNLAAGAPPAARTSLGAGFWVVLACAALALADAGRRLGRSGAARYAGVAVILMLSLATALGMLDQLSLAKELANRREVFAAAVLRHVQLVIFAVVPTIALGVPLGVLVHRRARWRTVAFPVLNVIQTIPSMALFAILIGPLSALVAAVPALRQAGIAGVGAAPAVVALLLYSLLPTTRATAEGLAGVPRDAVEAGQGIGMTPSQLFWKVELPLAIPVILAGLRVTTVQAIGLAAVAALIGAGGLGALMFQGIYANALDLVLLGTIPVILLALAADALFRMLAAGAEGRR